MSRPAAAGTKWLQAEGFTSIDLEAMTPSNIKDFVGRWHEALLQADANSLPFSRAEVEERHRGLLAQLDARAHLRSLARSPLMCAMLCALNLDRSGDLPRDRKSLYSAALEMLLDRRDAVRGIAADGEFTLGSPEKLLILQDLAFWLNINGRSELDRSTAVDHIERKVSAMTAADVDADACLKNLVERSGVIREPAEGRIDFVHRTFHEFLAAREAAEDGHAGLHHQAVLIHQASLVPYLRELRNLQHAMANFEDDNIDDLQFSAGAPNLCSLRVYTHRVLSARGIAGHPGIRKLTLVCNQLLHEDELRELPNLTNLFLNQRAGFSSVEFLAKLAGLEFLRIGLRPDSGTSAFENLANLRDLMLDADNAIDVLAKLPHPQQMTQLSILSSARQPVEFIAAQFPNLRGLHLSMTTSLDELGLDRLPELNTLQVRPETSNFGSLSALAALRLLDLPRTRKVDLSSLTNERLTVLVDADAVIEGADRLPTGTHVKRRRPHVDREARWKASRRSYYRDAPVTPPIRTTQTART
ncbi:hypothetical protein ABT337_15010 [Saccharopolyspora hirsuta]|uniref:Leucine-rich repeat domain-containing protein n=1 Tax=Saccharopolyspora hirsuta TaxID=1837 RepID=A0A5M7CC60_SACHI|nr:hypothetical protein [Saccharopolyspora hirsuta]KAA5837294.1 hypothetical protein F1721_05730 [Saccharopolyspora hirsuta]